MKRRSEASRPAASDHVPSIQTRATMDKVEQQTRGALTPKLDGCNWSQEVKQMGLFFFSFSGSRKAWLSQSQELQTTKTILSIVGRELRGQPGDLELKALMAAEIVR